jgi:hypothetical protein
MLISCLESERGVIVRRDDGCETAVKENDDGEWSSDNMVL